MKRLVLLGLISFYCSAQTVWFEPNVGQVKGQTEWVGRSKGTYLYITGNEVVYANKTNIHMRLIGATAHPRVEGIEPTGSFSNYFTGRDEKTWFTGIPHYARLRYRDVYPGIDLLYHASGKNTEYDFIVKPGGNPDRIELAFSEPVKFDKGDLVVGRLRQHKPKVQQSGRVIAAEYRTSGGDHVKLALGSHEPSLAMVIDPVLEFSTYLGGPGSDQGIQVVRDASGSNYLTGCTQAPASPSLNPFQQTNIVNLAPYVMKLSPQADRVVFFSVFGSNGWDCSYGLALDPSGNLVITGKTRSPNFPLKNPIQSSLATQYGSGFVTKLSPDGRSLVYSTYFGGSVSEDPRGGVQVDSQGNAYLSGNTLSPDLPTFHALQSRFGGGIDCYIAKLSPLGQLVFSTYFGGSGTDSCAGMALGRDGSLLVVGGSSSSDLPLKDPQQIDITPRTGYMTPILVKISQDGQNLLHSTFLGGPVAGEVEGIALDVSGNIYLAGNINGGGLITKNAFQNLNVSSASVFLMKFDPQAHNVIYSTYLGGSGGAGTYLYPIAVDQSGSAYVGGLASSADFPTRNSLGQFHGGGINQGDFFVTKFAPAGNSVVYSTFLGGSGNEIGASITVDPDGTLYGTGITSSPDFLTHNAYQSAWGGSDDAVLFKISDSTPLPTSPLMPSPGSISFQYVQGGPVPPSQTVTVAGGPFTTTANDSWVSITSQTGSSVNVSVSPSKLSVGVYNSTVVLNPPAATPALVTLTLVVVAPAAVLTLLEPSIVAVGSDDTKITVHGSGFTSKSVLQVNGSPWMTTPVQYVDGSTLTFSIPAGYLSSPYTFAITVQNPQAALSSVLPLSVGVAAPQFISGSVVNAGSFAGGPVAPGELVTIFGTNLTGNVTFDNIPATIVYSSATQISATVPYSVLGPKTSLQVGSSVPVSLDVAPSAPGIFAAVANGDGTLTLYATGCGQLTQDALPLCQLPVSATINADSAEVLYAGIAPGLVQGANQVNLILPSDIASGPISIVLSAGTASSKPFSYTLP